MKETTGSYTNQSRLILHKTSKKEIDQGIPVITKGVGVHVFDQDGRRYLDLVSAVTRPIHVGYGRKEIAQAVYDQICELPYFTPMQYTTVPAMKLADVLAEITPRKLNRFIFVCDGSEAVDTAIKLAQHYHTYRGEKKRFKVISQK